MQSFCLTIKNYMSTKFELESVPDLRNFITFYFETVKQSNKLGNSPGTGQVPNSCANAYRLGIMNYARKPPQLSSTGPMDQNCKNWKQQFLIFLKASGANTESTDMKASYLMNLMGPVAIEVRENLSFDSPSDREDFDILLKKFDKHFLPKETETNMRFIFFTSVKQQSESIQQYVNKLKVRAAACKFGDLTESLIRDKIVMDVKDKILKKGFLHKSNLSLTEAIESWEKREEIETSTNLHLPKSIPKTNGNPSKNLRRTISEKICQKCGTNHNPKECPAWGKTCENCGMVNHIEEVCTKPSIHKSVSNIATTKDEVVNESLKEVPKFFNPGPIVQVPKFTKKDMYD